MLSDVESDIPLHDPSTFHPSQHSHRTQNTEPNVNVTSCITTSLVAMAIMSQTDGHKPDQDHSFHSKTIRRCILVSQISHLKHHGDLPEYSGKQMVRADFLIFSSNKSFLFRKRIMEVSTNHLLLQMESNSFMLSIILKIRNLIASLKQSPGCGVGNMCVG